MKHHAAWIAFATLTTVALTTLAITGAADPCANCLRARIWTIPADDWTQTGDPTNFPETSALTAMSERRDLGIAFSGGGTRSASATLGQLRGLEHNGWLKRVRYMTAVSGGTWAALPYAYWKESSSELLGDYQEPEHLQIASVLDVPNGALTDAIAHSRLVNFGLQEAASQIGGLTLREDANAAVTQILKLLGEGRERGRVNKTYSRALESAFISPLFGPQSRLRVGWNQAKVDEAVADNPGRLSPHEFIKIPDDRPFLIAGAVLIPPHPSFYYPPLAPIEYTPYYSGIRQRFGKRVGGTYMSTWAYDSVDVARDGETHVRVRPGANGRSFVVADVISSSGAAPQLPLILGARGKSLVNQFFGTFAGYFPSYHHLVAEGTNAVSLTPEIPHGDGGFMDFFGIMPLLARHVRNIMVFANSNNDFDANNDLASLFYEGTPSGTADRSMNVVFEARRYNELMRELSKRREAGEPAVYCGTGWHVSANETYNIRAYDNLNVCWIYVRAAKAWTDKLPRDIRTLMATLAPGQKPSEDQKKAGSFADFPWYRTFYQKPPFVIELSNAQVNLLSNLTAWMLVHPSSATQIKTAFGNVLD